MVLCLYFYGCHAKCCTSIQNDAQKCRALWKEIQRGGKVLKKGCKRIQNVKTYAKCFYFFYIIRRQIQSIILSGGREKCMLK